MTAASLVDRVAHQADEEAEKRVAAARAEATRLRQTGDERRAARRREALEVHAVELKRAHDQACADAAVRTASAMLTARARFLDRVFAAAEQGLMELSSPEERGRCLDALLRDAVSYLDPANCIVHDSVGLGAIVESADGRVRVDATLTGLIQRRRPELSVLALAAFSEAP